MPNQRPAGRPLAKLLLLLAIGAQAATAALAWRPSSLLEGGPVPVAHSETQAPQVVTGGMVDLDGSIQKEDFDAYDFEATADRPTKTYKGRVLTGRAAARRCQYPMNQVFWNQDTETGRVKGFWFGAYSYNGYAFSDNPEGGNVPGAGGASCSDPPLWGPAFPAAGGCAGTPPPLEVGTFQWTLPNARDAVTNTTMVSLVTGFKVYYDKRGAVVRHELKGGLWSGEAEAREGRGRGWTRTWEVGYGVSKQTFRRRRARVVVYEAPEGMVLGSVFKAKCAGRKGAKGLARLLQACAVAPAGYPQDLMFKDVTLAKRYGYGC